MNKLTFCTTLERDTLDPLDFSITGELVIDGERTPIGFTSTNFDKVFDELRYWTRQIVSADVTFTTTMLD